MDRALPQKQWTKKKVIQVVLFSALAFWAYFTYWDSRSTKLKISAKKLLLATVEKKNFQESILINGVVNYGNESIQSECKLVSPVGMQKGRNRGKKTVSEKLFCKVERNICSTFCAEVDPYYSPKLRQGIKGFMSIARRQYPVHLSHYERGTSSGKVKLMLAFDTLPPVFNSEEQFTQIRLNLSEQRETLVLPKGAFFETTGGHWVYVMDDSQKKAIKRKITLGAQNAEFFEVLEGLEDGDIAVISSYEEYKNYDYLIVKR